MQLAAQSALIGVSEAQLYPSIALVGSLGLSSTSLAWSTHTLDWAAGPSLVWNVFDYGRLRNDVLVQDARFQQLHEVYQDTVLRAARELDDAAVAFAKNKAQVEILEQAVQAARRSLDIATIQYQEGLVDFERVLDSQRSLFSQEERLVATRGAVTQSLVALYKATGGGWEGGRGAPGARRGHPRRHDGAQRLERPAECAAARPDRTVPTVREGRPMSDEPPRQSTAAERPPRPRPPAGGGTRIGAIVVTALIVASLVTYFVGDRLTPYSSQARVQAFVVPVAAEVSGKVLKVHIRNDDRGASPASRCSTSIPTSTRSRCSGRARTTSRCVDRSTRPRPAVDAARASLHAAEAGRDMAEKDAARQERLHAEDPGAISVRRLEIAQSTREEARSKARVPRRTCVKAQEAAGDAGENNAQLRSARAAVEKAELDLAHTKVVAPAARHRHRPARGRRQFCPSGRAGHDADCGARRLDQRGPDREQSRARRSRRRGGDRVRRDAGPGLQGPRPQHRRRRRQRPVVASRDAAHRAEQQGLAAAGAAHPGRRRTRRRRRLPKLRGVRVGGQAAVLVYTDDDNAVMNALGAAYIRVMSWLSYLY